MSLGVSLQEGFVYVIEGSDKRLKIGFTKKPKDRLRALEYAEDGIYVWALIEGCLGDERRLQRRYAAHHISGDWFHWNHEIVDDCENGRLGRRGGLCKFSRPLVNRTALSVSNETCRHCGGDASDNSFDRSLCACGAMHTFHNSCGRPLDDCPYDVESEVALTPADLGWLRGLARGRVRKQRRRVESYEGEDSVQADRLRANLARMEATLARLEPLAAEDWEWENDD